MRNNLCRKRLVIGIIIVMVGASITLDVNGNTDRHKTVESNRTIKNMGQIFAENSRIQKPFLGDPPNEEWNKTFGRYYSLGYSVKQTTDDGYIITGMVENNDLWIDLCLIRTDANGNEIWNKTFGGTEVEYGTSVLQVKDGGYVAAGITTSYGTANGFDDFWLIKTDANGNELWNKTFGGIGWDRCWSVLQTSDEGYIMVGYTETYAAGMEDVWMVRTDANGNEIWNKTFGGSQREEGYSVQHSQDGGYIISGMRYSEEPGVNGNPNYDVWLIKTDANGIEEWNNTFGGSLIEEGRSVQQTIDSGFIIICRIEEWDPEGFPEETNAWLIKTDANGNEVWNKTFGGSDFDTAWSGQQTSDGGYIITGSTCSYAVDYDDVWLIKTDTDGTELWNITFGGDLPDTGLSVQQTRDGGYIITGQTYSYEVENFVLWLIKVASENQPPNIPGNPSPSHGATGVTVNTTLSWTGGDPDLGDTVMYDVYFGTTSPPPKVVSNQSATTYNPGTMNYNTEYYWKIVAWDNNGALTEGSIWDFTTENRAPNVPSNPNPSNGAPGVNIDTNLSWTGGDPDPEDTVTYDVFFGTTTPPTTKVSTNQSGTSYDPGTMNYHTTYYWKIRAWDNHSASNTSDTWNFTTAVNHPPSAPSKPNPMNHAPNVPITVDLSWNASIDPDGDPVKYDVYFGTTNPPPKIPPGNQSGTTYNPGTMNYNTKYYWKIVAWDNHSASNTSDTWNFTTAAAQIVPPTVTTNAATNILKNSATLNGNLGDMGGDTSCQVWFQYGTTTSYGTNTSKQDKTSIGTFSADISGLNPNTTYHFRAVANNTAGRTNGTDLAFKTAAAPAPKPDLDCQGTLNWTSPKITPGATVTGSFIVKNIGQAASKLNWEVKSWPSWGTWTFNPSSGANLTPGASVTVQVTVVTPNEKNKAYTGEVKIVNKNNSSDSCIIQASLITPKNKSLVLHFLDQLLERFPVLGRILSSLPFINRLLSLYN